MASFAELLKSYREQVRMSQRSLARTSHINPAIISRLESGDRLPSGPAQVLAITQALALDEPRANRLLASAGYWPKAILELGPQDETLLAIAGVLTDGVLSADVRNRFRQVVQLLADQWRARGE